VELEPQNKNAYELLSLTYMQAAQKYMDKFNETEDPTYQQRANEFFTEAMPILEEATQKFPDSSLLWNNLGVCYAQKNMKDKAEKAFEMQKKLEENE
jgi:Flp pilus assembly protein TadD